MPNEGRLTNLGTVRINDPFANTPLNITNFYETDVEVGWTIGFDEGFVVEKEIIVGKEVDISDSEPVAKEKYDDDTLNEENILKYKDTKDALDLVTKLVTCLVDDFVNLINIESDHYFATMSPQSIRQSIVRDSMLPALFSLKNENRKMSYARFKKHMVGLFGDTIKETQIFLAPEKYVDLYLEFIQKLEKIMPRFESIKLDVRQNKMLIMFTGENTTYSCVLDDKANNGNNNKRARGFGTVFERYELVTEMVEIATF